MIEKSTCCVCNRNCSVQEDSPRVSINFTWEGEIGIPESFLKCPEFRRTMEYCKNIIPLETHP